MSVTDNALELLRSGYTSSVRAVSTEASYSALRNESCFKDFQLIEIPEVMEQKMNAREGAALMRRWFTSPKFTLPESWRDGTSNSLGIPSQNIDTSIIKMGWISRFPRANNAITQLERTRVTTPAAAKELRRLLKRQHFLTQQREPIGISNDAIILHETTHLNYFKVPFGGGVDPLDCAIAAFTMHMAIGGFVQPIVDKSSATTGTHEVEIVNLHFYTRDSYDFNTGNEPLGFWGRDGASTAIYSKDKSFVENRNFREWRALHGMAWHGWGFSSFLGCPDKNFAKNHKDNYMNKKSTIRRTVEIIYLTGASLLILLGWAAWANVHDTQSQKFGAFVIHDLAIHIGLTGFFLSLIGIAFRLIHARWIFMISMLLGVAITTESIYNYPTEADDSHYSYVFSPTKEALCYSLFGGIALILIAAWVDRKEKLTDKT